MIIIRQVFLLGESLSSILSVRRMKVYLDSTILLRSYNRKRKNTMVHFILIGKLRVIGNRMIIADILMCVGENQVICHYFVT
ncbi:hypothetical protein D3C73_690750 [compost metagenome]